MSKRWSGSSSFLARTRASSVFPTSVGPAKRKDATGVSTGFTDLDKLLNGLQPSDLLIVAGRPGQGKTGFLLTIAKNAGLTYKKRVAIFSLEMSN